VTAVIVPADVQELDYSPPAHAFKVVPSSLGMASWAPVPDEADISRAAEIRNAGEKVAVLIGQARARPRTRCGSWRTPLAPEWLRRCWARTRSPMTCPT
jgi:pyruvate dehydrogenase (quinone)